MRPLLGVAGHGAVVVGVEVPQQRRALEGAGADVVDEADEGVELRLVQRHADGVVHGVGRRLRIAAQQPLGLLLADAALELDRLRAVAGAEVDKVAGADRAVPRGIVVEVRRGALRAVR